MKYLPEMQVSLPHNSGIISMIGDQY